MDYRIREALSLLTVSSSAHLPRLALLAARFNLSPSRFRHLFCAHTGEPFRKYCRRQRLSRAANLLTTTHLTVKEIVWHVGYGDQSHFTRDFRRQHGLTPKQWRLHTRGESAGGGSSSKAVAHCSTLNDSLSVHLRCVGSVAGAALKEGAPAANGQE